MLFSPYPSASLKVDLLRPRRRNGHPSGFVKSGRFLAGSVCRLHEMNATYRCRSSRSLKTKEADFGFSLLELLVVVAIISLLLTLLVPAFSSIGKGNELAVSGGRFVDLLNLARVNAMSKNAMTAVVINTDSSSEGAFRSIVLMELSARNDGTLPTSADWKQTTKWEQLRQGIIVQGPLANGSTPTPSLPALKYQSQVLTSTYSVFFLPNGSLLDSAKTTAIRLAKSDGNLSNYFDVTILPASGRTKIDRP